MDKFMKTIDGIQHVSAYAFCVMCIVKLGSIIITKIKK